MPKTGEEMYGWAAFSVGSYTKSDLEDTKKCNKINNVEDVIRKLGAKITNINPVVIKKPDVFIELSDQFINAEKIIKLGFRPEVDFDEGLSLSIAWYKDNFSYLERLVNQSLPVDRKV